jgi:1,4-dihydroxy-2-naphthoate octaprenyltransferase
MTNFRFLIRVARPLYLIFAAMTFVLGSGMAHYLGSPLRPATFTLGLGIAFLLQVSAFLLTEYFHLPALPLAKAETARQRERVRALLLQVAAAALVLATAGTIILLHARLLTQPAGAILALIFVFLMAFAVPPLRLSDNGYGELVLAVYFATLLPAFSFLLQSGGYHRLLAMTTFPLTLLALAYLLVLDFPTYASDQMIERHTLLTRMTWQGAIPLHHLLILAAYLLFASAPFFGFPWGLVWPVFLSFPFAAIQVIWLQRIARGGRTYWNFLTSLAAAVFGLTAYLLALTYWLR